MNRINFQISYHGEDAEENKLSAYGAAVSLHGISRALAITTHALLNDGEVRSKASMARGAEIYFYAPRRGSFQQIIEVVLNNPEASGIGASVVGNVFYDFLKWSWKQATGDANARPETPYVRNLAERREELADEIAAGLESSLAQAHKPIKDLTCCNIAVNRRRTGTLVRLDEETLKFVETRETEPLNELIGNVTRYNYLSGIGRLYDSDLDKTVSFEVGHNFPGEKTTLLPWSMSQAMGGNEKNLTFSGRRVLNVRGDVKRMILSDARRVDPFDEEVTLRAG